MPMSRAFLALGGNLGNRQATLRRAVIRLRAEPSVRVVRASSLYETAPVGGPDGQNPYLNGVIEVETTLPPDALLTALLRIEQEFGRKRGELNAPRTLDLDVLFIDDIIRTDADPLLPHPRLHERHFVLVPLAEIAPDVIHPTLKLSTAQLLERLPAISDPPKKIDESPAVDPFELTGLRAVVTGSTGGIGKAIADKLTRAGAEVITHGRRAPAQLQADLSHPAACPALVEQAWAIGDIDIWVNNAGADVLTGEAADWSFERKWQELLAVDLTATMKLSRLVGARMVAGRGGSIINMGWDQAETGMEGDSGQLFGTIKAGVMAFSRSLGLSLAPKVRVNCVAPGWIRTAWGETASDTWQERVRRETPLLRWGLPEDVANTVRWLASPAAAFITGQTIRINGGAVRA